MAAKKRTRKEKERARYRLEASWLKAANRLEKREMEEFAYLEARYIKRDLLKTLVYSVLMLGVLGLAKWYLG